jgi:hypothetical protein
MVSISNKTNNKRGLDGKIVLKALQELENPKQMSFNNVKNGLLNEYFDLIKMNEAG